jgi:hypothetical protein
MPQNPYPYPSPSQKERLKAMMSGAGLMTQKKATIKASVHYSEAAALYEVSDEDVTPLGGSQDDIQEFLEKRTTQLLAILDLDTNPIFRAWQVI